MKVLVITISLVFSLILLFGCRSRRVVETQAENIQASTLFRTGSGQIMIIKRPSLYVNPGPGTTDTTKPQCRIVRRGQTPITPDTTIITWNVQDTSVSSSHITNHSITTKNQGNIMADVMARALTYISLNALALFCCIIIFLVLKWMK